MVWFWKILIHNTLNFFLACFLHIKLSNVPSINIIFNMLVIFMLILKCVDAIIFRFFRRLIFYFKFSNVFNANNYFLNLTIFEVLVLFLLHIFLKRFSCFCIFFSFHFFFVRYLIFYSVKKKPQFQNFNLLSNYILLNNITFPMKYLSLKKQ